MVRVGPDIPRWIAVLDRDGRYADGDSTAFAALGLDPATDRVQVPRHPRQVWGWSADASTQYRIDPRDHQWTLECGPAQDAHLPRKSLRRLQHANLAAVGSSRDLDATVRLLAREFTRLTGLSGATMVLIDPTGSPTFAGGVSAGHRQLAAMERCRRNGAPMAIWQAFEEARVIVDRRWFQTAREDARFAPIAEFFYDGLDGVYVTIPLHGDRGVIGVVSGMWPPEAAIDGEAIARWQAAADCLAVALQYSEVIRRAYVRGSVSARTRLNDDLHATIAQGLFALALEFARVERGDMPPGVAIGALRAMTDDLVADVRSFLEDARDGLEGPSPIDRMDELTKDALRRSGARIVIDHQVGWETYSSAFLDDVVRIVGEALRNSIKHASPSVIELRSWVDSATQDVMIEIADDGHGNPEPAVGASTGMGLSMLRDLVESRGGSLELTTSGSGAVLTVRLSPDYESEWAIAQRLLASRSAADG